MEAPTEAANELIEEYHGSESAGGGNPSKKSLKRQVNRESWKEYQQAKKKAKKESARLIRAENKAKLQVERELREPDAAALAANVNDHPRAPRMSKEEKQAEFLARTDKNFEIIIDCGWEDEHPDKAMTSLIQQIMYCYGANRKSAHPAKFSLFNLGPRVRRGLEKIKFESWIGFRAVSEDLLSTDEYQTLINNDSTDGKKELIYLTSDADEVLTDLNPNHAYVIGGIVDRNRLKGATLKKAQSLHIRTAKLPIKEYLQLSTTHILTVNHVFDILIRFQESKDWRESLAVVLPQRKEATARSGGSSQAAASSSRHSVYNSVHDAEDGQEVQEQRKE